MSNMLPESVSSSNQWKLFWSRPEGKMGIILLILLGVLGIWAWGTVSAFLVAMLADTVHMAMLGGLLFGMGWVAFSKRSHMLFRLISRALTGILINIDPIGIAEDKVLQMKKRRQQFGEQITNVNGQKRILTDTINKNKLDAEKNIKFAAEARRQGAQSADAEKARQMQLQSIAAANRAGRREQSNIGYQQLLVKITTVYDLLTKWATNMDFFIEDTTDQVDQAKMNYKVTNAAFSAIKTGMAIIRGDASENDIYDRAMQQLADDASLKLGAIEDFQRVAQDFMNTIDIQNGVVDTDALKKLDQYEQKLLTNGEPAFLLPTATTKPEAVPVPAKKGYDDLLR